MEKQNESERVKRLIKNGFDIQLISLELDIPIKEVKKYQRQIEKENAKNENENPLTASKMEKVRERYMALYTGTNESKSETTTKISEEDLEKVRKSIKIVEEQITGIEGISKKQAISLLVSIFGEVSIIVAYELPFMEAEKISGLINSTEIENLITIFKSNESIVQAMGKTKKNINIRLADAINRETEKTEDIEELQKLNKKLTPEMEQQIPQKVAQIKSKIHRKISVATQQKEINKRKNDLPTNLSQIATSLVNGELDIQIANEIINQEAKKRLESKPRNKFALTEQQERNQILIQIRTAIRENFEAYPVRNPEKTISQLQQLCNGEQGNIVTAVVYNLIGRKRFEAAKTVCQGLASNKNQDDTMRFYIKKLQDAIRAAEINSFVLKGITMQGTPEEENAYFNQIEIRIKRGDIKPESVSLGKTRDGSRTITLADVWTEEKNKKKRGVNR